MNEFFFFFFFFFFFKLIKKIIFVKIFVINIIVKEINYETIIKDNKPFSIIKTLYTYSSSIPLYLKNFLFINK